MILIKKLEIEIFYGYWLPFLKFKVYIFIYFVYGDFHKTFYMRKGQRRDEDGGKWYELGRFFFFFLCKNQEDLNIHSHN